MLSYWNSRYQKNILDRSFYLQPCTSVAKSLLWKYLVREIWNLLLVWKIIETEAYLWRDDTASHTYIGKTHRNKSCYEDWWVAYIHSMRQYCLLDVVTESWDIPSSVLIRACEVIDGIDIMMTNRNTLDLKNMLNGPWKICKAMNITKSMDWIDLTNTEWWLYIVDLQDSKNLSIIETTRIWISKSKELPLRFIVW